MQKCEEIFFPKDSDRSKNRSVNTVVLETLPFYNLVLNVAHLTQMGKREFLIYKFAL